MAKYKDLAVYQPVINGVGGNLVSVQASRLSTELHKNNELGKLPPSSRICISPLDAFFSKRKYSKHVIFGPNKKACDNIIL
jgi:solute carrier family 41